MPEPRSSDVASTFGSGFERLRAWALDEAHLVQSVRMHEPTYRNPSELRADVRELLARFDALYASRERAS